MFLDDMEAWIMDPVRKPDNLNTLKKAKDGDFVLVKGQTFFTDLYRVTDDLGSEALESPIKFSRQVSLIEIPGRNFAVTGREQIGGSIFTMGGGTPRCAVAERFGLSIIIRSEQGEYGEARQIGQELYDSLNGMSGHETDMESEDPHFKYEWVTANHPLYYWDEDTNFRPYVGCDFTITAIRKD